MLQVRVAITDTVSGESISFDDTIEADFQVNAEDGAWKTVTTDEEKEAHKQPGFKQKAWALARTMFRAWRHTYGQYVRKLAPPAEPPPPTGDIPTSVEP